MQNPSSKKEIKDYFSMQNQLELLKETEQLHEEQLALLAKQISKIKTFFPKQIDIDHDESFDFKDNIVPFKAAHRLSKQDITLGLKALNQGLVCCVILAGGDGSRLNYKLPKGCFPISPIMKKSLFQLQLEKIKILQEQISHPLKTIILTSEKNKQETLSFLESHHFFGLDPSLIELLEQPSIPLFDKHHRWFFQTPERLATGPNGNGGFIDALFHSSLIKKLRHDNCRHIFLISIDNPLATPFDPRLIGHHLSKQSDISLYCFQRNCPNEQTGLFAYVNNKLVIIDYNNFDRAKYALQEKKEFIFPLANSNIFCLSLDFLEKIYLQNLLPIHWVKKVTSKYNFSNQKTESVSVWKGEKFITDILKFSDKVSVIAMDKDSHFAPLKSLHGINDIASVQKAIFKKNQLIYQELTGQLTEALFELSMRYYIPFGQHPPLSLSRPLEGAYIE